MRPPAWLPPTLIATTGLSLAYWLWAHTGEILLDFGNELYVAWQLSQGKTLYRDIAYLFGPLSPTINATVMRLFGPGLTTILIANFIILILTTALLYRLLGIMASSLAATTATIFFLCIFALSAPTRLTNYNFLTPYAHPITHGFLLCLAAFWCVDWFYRRGSIRAVIAGGLFTGLAFLTKPEIFLGCALAYVLGLIAAIWLTRRKRIARTVAAAVAASLLPPLAAFGFFASKMPIRTAIGGVLSGWQFVSNTYVLSTPFYKGSFGADEPATNFLRMLQCAGIYAAAASALTLLALIAGRLLGRWRWAPFAAALAIAAAACCSLLQIGNRFDSFWSHAGHGLPVFAVFAVIATARRLAKARADLKIARQALLQWTLAILSLAFLVKIPLYARLYQYGFVLAAPCGMLAVIALIDWLPNRIGRKSASPAIIQLGAIGFLAAFILHNLAVTQQVLRQRTLPIPLALGGAAWTRPDNSASVSAIRWLAGAPAASTAAVIPDAAGINYAAGRSSSVPYNELHPMGLNLYGQSTVTAAFDSHPPDFILIMDFPETALGARAFGRDYGLQLSNWIARHYRPIVIFSGGNHPIDVWLRLPSQPASTGAQANRILPMTRFGAGGLR
jgi:4-amino-4-deoxy-L-arabinose transferase-like glycosyltransferase